MIISNDELTKWVQNEFHLTRKPSDSTISRIWEKRMQYLDIYPQYHHIQCQHVVIYIIIEEILIIWILQNQYQKFSIAYEVIQEKNKRFANSFGIGDVFKFSNNWLTLFCQRNGFWWFRQYGENDAVIIDMIEVQITIAYIKERIAYYDPNNTYNYDESGLFYNISSNTIIAR